MKKNQGSGPYFPRHRNDAGFTLIEVLVSITILTMVGFGIWSTFAGGVDLMRRIPVTGNMNLEILKLDQAFRNYMQKIKFPFWVAELDIDAEDEILDFPYLDGYKDFELYIYTKREYGSDETYLHIEGNSDAMDKEIKETVELENINERFGPFSSVTYDYETDDDDNLIGATLTFSLMGNSERQISLYANVGGMPFWKP